MVRGALMGFVATLAGVGLLASMAASRAGNAVEDADDVRTGGETTVWADGRNAFSFPLANLSDEERSRFAVGNSSSDAIGSALHCPQLRRLPCAGRARRTAGPAQAHRS
jgi:hypothetical protein